MEGCGRKEGGGIVVHYVWRFVLQKEVCIAHCTRIVYTAGGSCVLYTVRRFVLQREVCIVHCYLALEVFRCWTRENILVAVLTACSEYNTSLP